MDWGRQIFLVCALAMGAACADQQKNTAGGRDSAGEEGVPMRTFKGPFTNTRIQINAATSKVDELIWSIGDCQCLGRYLDQTMRERALQHGALPQALMPPIREQIRNNETLKTVLDVPLIGGLLADVFASDEKIAGEIRTGIQTKLSQFVPGGSQLDQTIAYRFDGFRPLRPSSQPPTNFVFHEQIPFWHLYFAHPGLWEGKTPMAAGEHGLQSVEVMRTLVEWKYLFGLDANPTGGHYGGLSIDINSPTKPAGKFDPRESPDAQRFFNGQYTIEYPPGSALDLATKTSERWRLGSQAITLNHQARMWHTAALAFKRLRPDQRQPTQSLYGPDGQAILPANAHQLALAFLPGLEGLLSRIIDRDTRIVRREAFGADEAASLLDLVRLINAVHIWVEEMSNLQGADVPASSRAQLEQAPARMLPAIQVAIQNILRDHVIQNKQIIGNALVTNAGARQAPDLAVIGEVVVALQRAESGAVGSPLLKSKIAGLGHWLIGEVLQNTTITTPEGAAWGVRALNALERGGHTIPGIDAARSALKNALSQWEGRQ